MDLRDEVDQREITRRVNMLTEAQQRAFLKPCLTRKDCENPYYFTGNKVKDERLPHRIMFEQLGLTFNADDSTEGFDVVWPGYCAWHASVAYRKKHASQPLLPTDDWNMWLQGRAGVELERLLVNVGTLPRTQVHSRLAKADESLHLLVRCSDLEMELFRSLYPMAPMFRVGPARAH